MPGISTTAFGRNLWTGMRIQTHRKRICRDVTDSIYKRRWQRMPVKGEVSRKYIPIGVDDFKEIRDGNHYFDID